MKFFRNGLESTQATLLKYPSSKRSQTAPLLVVFALVNKPYILDLEPNRSLIRRLNERGQFVYLLDWGTPTIEDAAKGLSEYILGDLNTAVDWIIQHENTPQIDILGICQGGYFSLCYTSIFPEKIRKLTTMVTPVDFHAPGCRLFQLTRYIDIQAFAKRFELIPGKFLVELFNWVAPFKTLKKKSAKSDKIDSWLKECPDQPTRLMQEFAGALIENSMMKGELQIGDYIVNLKKITQPLLNIYALDDHFWSPKTPAALRNLQNSTDYKEVILPCGHLGGLVGQCQAQVADEILSFCA